MKLEQRWKTLDKLKRKLFLKTELKKKLIASLFKNQYLPITHRYLMYWHKSQITRISSSTQIQNRCIKSGRIWSVKKITQYSRFIFRNESYKGHLPGFKRASW